MNRFRHHHVCSLRVAVVVMAAISTASATVEAVEPDAEQLEFFEQQVRPLLVKRCYECHSTEADAAEGGLRLDSRSGWETGGDSGAAIEAGNVEGSLLITAIRYEDFEMPPEGKMAADEIAILERWVGMGAPDPRTDPVGSDGDRGIDWEQAREFWAFQQPQRHTPPSVELSGWPADEVDRFILAKVEAAGLTPTIDANRHTWLRRVTFDLTGLPPTPKELDAFLADEPAEATARVVDRLLASSAFGEHWGRHWLDVARYADTNGGDFNATFKSAWRYRDYVIAAFNDDKPFDEFVREQLAGDLLPFDNREQEAEQLIATGFLMIGCKMLSERDKAKFQMDVVDEQIDTVGRAFLGLTLGCARCHDHKFDPLPTADYYALAGIFQSTETYRGESQKYVSTWKEVDLPIKPEMQAAIDQHAARKKELETVIADLEQQEAVIAKQLSSLDPNFAAEWNKREQKPKDGQILSVSGLAGIVVDDTQAKLVGDWKASTNTPHYVGAGYIHNNKQGLGEKTVTFTPDLPAVGRYEVRMSFAASGGRATNVPVVIVHANGEERLTVDQSKTPPIDKLWLSLGTFPFDAGTGGSVTIRTEDTNGYVLTDAVQFLPEDKANTKPAEVAATPEVVELRKQLTVLTGPIKEAKTQLNQHAAAAPPAIPTCMAVREQEVIGDAAIRIRGEVHREGEIIPRGFLTVFGDETRAQLTDTSQSGRAELAAWIASSDNPLTARVMVNRVWHHLFGRGIVATVDNFGKLGQQPTHPELLDTLAVDFMEDDWSVKRLIRRVVLSRTYGLSSTPPVPVSSPSAAATTSEVNADSDPENDLLTHFRRRRLTAEPLRDAMLAISGQLDRTAGGSSVEPLSYLAIATSGSKSADLKVEENVRSSVYLPMVRNDLPEFLRLFDIADPELVTGRRPVTNVPAQALYLMNSPFVAQTAEQATSQLMAEFNDDQSRLQQAYSLLLSRVPTDAEQERALTFLQDEGGTASPEAWGRLIHILLASTEFRMLD